MNLFDNKVCDVKNKDLISFFENSLDFLFIKDSKTTIKNGILATYQIDRTFISQNFTATYQIDRGFLNNYNLATYNIDRNFKNETNYPFYKLGLAQPLPKRVIIKGFDD